jgi:hypothetical protein
MYLGYLTRIPSTFAALGWHLYFLMFGKKLSIGGAHGVGAIAFISIPSLRNAFICSMMKTLCVLTSGVGNMWDSVSTLKAITSLPCRTMTYHALTLQWCIPYRENWLFRQTEAIDVFSVRSCDVVPRISR